MASVVNEAGGSDPGRDEADARSRWGAVIALALGIFGLVTTEFLPASLLTPLAGDLGVSAGAAGQAVTVTAVVAGLAAPGVVLLLPRTDRRLLVLTMSALLVASNVVTAVAPGLATLLLARVALGVALGAFWALSASLGIRLVRPADLPRAMAIIFTGVSAASVCAAPLGAFLGDLWGWRATFAAVGVVGLGILLAQAMVVPSMPAPPKASLRTFGELVSRRDVAVGLATVLLVISGHTAGFTYLRVFLEQVTRLDVGAISAVLLAFGVAGFVGNSLGGAIASRSISLAVGASALVLALSALCLVLFGSGVWAAALAAAAWGVAFGAFPVGIQSWVSRSAHDHAESGGALFVITWQSAIALGAVAGGLLVDGAGPLAAFGYQSAAALCGGLLMLAAARSRDPGAR